MTYLSLPKIPVFLEAGHFASATEVLQASGPFKGKDKLIKTVAYLSKPKPPAGPKAHFHRVVDKIALDKCRNILKTVLQHSSPFVRFANLNMEVPSSSKAGSYSTKRFLNDQTLVIHKIRKEVWFLSMLAQGQDLTRQQDYQDFVIALNAYMKDPQSTAELLKIVLDKMLPSDPQILPLHNAIVEMLASDDSRLLLSPLRAFMGTDLELLGVGIDQGQDTNAKVYKSIGQHLAIIELVTARQILGNLAYGVHEKRRSGAVKSLHVFSTLGTSSMIAVNAVLQGKVSLEFSSLLSSYNGAMLKESEKLFTGFGIYFETLCGYISEYEGISKEDIDGDYLLIKDQYEYAISQLKRYLDRVNFFKDYIYLKICEEGCALLEQEWIKVRVRPNSHREFFDFMNQHAQRIAEQMKKQNHGIILGRMNEVQLYKEACVFLRSESQFADRWLQIAEGCLGNYLEFCERHIVSDRLWKSFSLKLYELALKEGEKKAHSVSSDAEVKESDAESVSAAAPVVVMGPSPAAAAAAPAAPIDPLYFIEHQLFRPIDAFRAGLGMNEHAQASAHNALVNLRNVIELMRRLERDVTQPNRRSFLFQTIAALIGECNHSIEQLLLAHNFLHQPLAPAETLADRVSHNLYELFTKSHAQLQFLNRQDRDFLYFQLNRAEIEIRSLSHHDHRHIAHTLFTPALQYAQNHPAAPLRTVLSETREVLDRFFQVIYKFAHHSGSAEGRDLQAFLGHVHQYLMNIEQAAARVESPPLGAAAPPAAFVSTPFVEEAQKHLDISKARIGALFQSLEKQRHIRDNVLDNLMLRLQTEIQRHGQLKPAEMPLHLSQIVQDIYLIAEDLLDAFCDFRNNGTELSRHDFAGRMQALGLAMPLNIRPFLENGTHARNVSRYFHLYKQRQDFPTREMRQAFDIADHPQRELFVALEPGFEGVVLNPSQRSREEIEKVLLMQLTQMAEFINLLAQSAR